MWTIQYWFKDKEYTRYNSLPGSEGDWVYLWNQTFRIASVRYFPEMNLCCIDLTDVF